MVGNITFLIMIFAVLDPLWINCCFLTFIGITFSSVINNFVIMHVQKWWNFHFQSKIFYH